MSNRYIGGLIYNPPGGFSAYFDGTTGLNDTGGGLIGTSTSTFTVEAWVNMTAAPAGSADHGSLVGLDANYTTTTNYLSFGPDTAQKIRLFWYDGSNKTCVGSTVLGLGLWYHIAIVVNSNAITLYVNGVAETLTGTTTLTNRSGTSGQFNIGKNGQTQFKGYASNVRISNTARTISLPSGPYPADANTLVLACNASTLVSPAQGSSAITWETNTGVAGVQNPFPLTNLPNPAMGNAGNGVFTISQYRQLAAQNLWPAIDPFYENVVLNLHGNGTNGGQNNTFLDSSSNNFSITRNGNTTQGTFGPYGSLWSNYFDGNGDFLTASSALMAYGTANKNTDTFTCEAWIYLTTYGSPSEPAQSMSIISKGSIQFAWGVYSDGKQVVYSYDGNTRSSFSTATVPLNTWVNLAFTVSGGVITHYINGVASGTGTWYGIQTTTDELRIGRVFNTYWNGYISNLRISTVARTISLPTAGYTSDGNTALLTCQSNRFIDNSSNAYAITVNGNVSVQRFAPFNPPIPYDASWAGGSGYFDGSGDSLSVPANAAWNLGSGAFTIECWSYPTAAQSDKHLFSLNSSGGTGYWVLRYDTGTVPQFIYNNYGTSLTSSTAATVSQWNHIAMVSNGTTMSLYLNGTRVATASATSINDGSANALYIGSQLNASRDISGYMSGARLVKGTAVYDPSLSTLTVPTSPPTAITNTQLLLNFTNASIVDNAMMNDLETVGQAELNTTYKKFGTGSIAFDGSGDYLVCPSTPNLDFAAGDWTLELWGYRVGNGSATDAVGNVMAYTGASGGNNAIWLSVDNSGNIRGKVAFDGSNWALELSGTTAMATGNWYHLALTRSGSTVRLFVNGTQEASGTNSTNLSTYGTQASIGGQFSSGSRYFNGYIDDLRITKGYARYTANFTPQTSQWQDQ